MNEIYNVGDEVVVYLTEDDNDEGQKAIVVDRVIHTEDNIDYDVELLTENAIGYVLGGVAIQGAQAYDSYKRTHKKTDQARYQKEYRRRNKGKIKAYNKRRKTVNSSVEPTLPALLETGTKECPCENKGKMKECSCKSKNKTQSYNKKPKIVNSSVEMTFPQLLEMSTRELWIITPMRQVADSIKLLKDSMKKSIPVMTNVPVIMNKLIEANKKLDNEHIELALDVLSKHEATGKPENVQEEIIKHLMLVK